MLKKTTTYAMYALLGVVLLASSCKKDPFSEKEALQAQRELLAQKFSYDLAIANVGLQIQRVSDSAKIAIQNLVNKGATDLEKERLNSELALRLAEFNYLLQELRFRDSLTRVNNYVNSIGGSRSYRIRVIDAITGSPINNASVRVLPWGTSQFTSVKTTADGFAIFNNIILDEQAIFYGVDDNTGVTSATSMVRRFSIDQDPTIRIYRVTSSTPVTRVTGTLSANLDLTNSTSENLGAGHTVFVETEITSLVNGGVSGPRTVWSFSGITNTSGTYSVNVPRGYIYTVTPVPSTSSFFQRMYVNYFEGSDNQLIATPRIDSLRVSFTSTSSVLVSPSFVYGIYLKLPADSLSGRPVILSENASANFLSTLLSRVRRDIRSADGTRIDTVNSNFSVNRSLMNLNNNWGDEFYNYAVRLNSTGTARVSDTLNVEVVDMTGGRIIESAPALIAITDASGKVARIEMRRDASGNIVNGGRFGITNNFGASVFVSDLLSLLRNRSNSTPTGASQLVVNATGTTSSVNFAYGVSVLNANYTNVR
jgi:hypothetical protein